MFKLPQFGGFGATCGSSLYGRRRQTGGHSLPEVVDNSVGGGFRVFVYSASYLRWIQQSAYSTVSKGRWAINTWPKDAWQSVLVMRQPKRRVHVIGHGSDAESTQFAG